MMTAQLESLHFGPIEYNNESIVVFPVGLPAFETERQFIVIEQAATKPVVFLQSVNSSWLVFMAVPVELLIPEQYPLRLTAEEKGLLLLDEGTVAPGDLLLLAILTVGPSRSVTANLMAPVVIHTRRNRGIQSPQAHVRFGVEHPLTTAAGAVAPGEEPCL
jgi:flagellar assembly factor FliW